MGACESGLGGAPAPELEVCLGDAGAAAQAGPVLLGRVATGGLGGPGSAAGKPGAAAATAGTPYADTVPAVEVDDDSEAEGEEGEVAGHAKEVGWVARRRQELGAADASGEYRALLEEAKAGVHVLSKRWDLVYLLVPGLFCNKYPMYMHSTRNHLRDLGLDCRIASIDTGKSVEHNAASVAKIVELLYVQTGKRVLLVGHSKGGCDSVAAVSRYFDDLRAKVAGVVCLQSPLGGTPIANDLLGTRMRGVTMSAIKHVLGGEADALGDLTYERRQRELQDFPFPHEEVPLITLSSGTKRRTSVLGPLAVYMRRKYQGLETDGMVACPDADLPASTKVALEVDWDHGACAFPEPDAAEADSLVNEAAIALLVQSVALQGPGGNTFLEPVFDFWHFDHEEHTFHFGEPWGGERKNNVAFFAFTRPVEGAQPVYDFWHDGRAEHTFHLGAPREGERRNNVIFFAYPHRAEGAEPVHEFWHERNHEHTVHLGEPWDGEVKGEILFYAFRSAPRLHLPQAKRSSVQGWCMCAH